MLRAADRAQQGFFDASICAGILPEDSVYALLAEHGERIVCDEDFADCYCADRGRPSIPPSLLSKVLLLAYREGLSDERAMDALRFDLRWKVALELPLDHAGFHATSLVRFRARLLVETTADARDLGLRDSKPERLHDLVDLARGDPGHVGLLHDGHERLL